MSSKLNTKTPGAGATFKDLVPGGGGGGGGGGAAAAGQKDPDQLRFTVHQRKTIIAKDSVVRDAMVVRHKTKLIVDGVDITPKNLGTVDMEELLEDLDVDLGSGAAWSQAGAGKQRQTFFGGMVARKEFSGKTSGSTSRLVEDDDEDADEAATTNMDVILSQMDNINIVRSRTASSKTLGQQSTSASFAQSSSGGRISSASGASLLADSEMTSDGRSAVVPDELLPVLPTHIKIRVCETEDIDLYAAVSSTVPADDEEAAAVLADNELYDYLTLGKGRGRRMCDGEAQTLQTLYKTRSVNTDKARTACAGTYVSNFEMFDTYAALEASTQTVQVGEGELAVTTYKDPSVDDPDAEMKFGKSDQFKLCSMVLQRLLAGNTFRQNQKRFRNMIVPDPLDLDIQYKYRVEELWTYALVGHVDNSVTGLSWCQSNSDLLAIGYGVFDFRLADRRTSGYACVWSIKNPRYPERMYRYTCPVTAVQFSRQRPQLLAIGTYDGTVEVVDISTDTADRVARSHRDTSPGIEPVWSIKWIQSGGAGTEEELLTVAQDGLVMKYTISPNGPWLLGLQQNRLDRIVGDVEGLRVPNAMKLPIEANRHPQAFVLQVDPIKPDSFYVGTDEGCVHKCSTFYPQQYLGIMRVANGTVDMMEYSPWSPKIFMTCGSDWKVRVWVDDVFEPVLELGGVYEAVRWAAWSPVNSCILVSLTRSEVQLWNIRKNVIKPASQTMWRAGNVALTKCVFSRCGRSLVVGDAEGCAHVCALEDMPFDPHYQYEELEAALLQALLTKPALGVQVKSMGYLGYPGGKKGGRR